MHTEGKMKGWRWHKRNADLDISVLCLRFLRRHRPVIEELERRAGIIISPPDSQVIPGEAPGAKGAEAEGI